MSFFWDTFVLNDSFSVSCHLLVVAATVRCCRWSYTSEHTDAEDSNQIDQYSHSKSVYQHKWYKYSLSFLALISTTETPPPPPFCPLNQIDRPADPLQTASQHYCTNCTLIFCLCFSLHHCWRRPHSLIIKVSFSAFCCSWESASRRKQPLGHSSCETLKLLMTFQVFYCKETSQQWVRIPHFCP